MVYFIGSLRGLREKIRVTFEYGVYTLGVLGKCGFVNGVGSDLYAGVREDEEGEEYLGFVFLFFRFVYIGQRVDLIIIRLRVKG